MRPSHKPSQQPTEPAVGSWARVLIAAIVIVLGATLLGALWLRHTYGTLDPSVPPPKLNVFGRDYRVSALDDASLATVMASHTDGVGVDILEPAIGAWPFVPFWVQSAVRPQYATPTVVWLQVGPDAYRAYELSGGP